MQKLIPPFAETRVPDDLDFITNGKAVADSRAIAADVGQDHDELLQTIDRLKRQVSDIMGAPAADAMFVERRPPSSLETAGRLQRHYHLARNAFDLLVSDLSGDDAIARVIDYVTVAAMEAKLEAFQRQSPTSCCEPTPPSRRSKR